METSSDLLEAQWVVEEIKGLIADGQLRSDMAILYRSNAQSRVIEQTLFHAGIPYRVFGGLRFFERAEVKHALAYLRLMENPHEDTAFSRVVNFPARGIGARSIEQLADLAKQQGSSLYSASGLLDGKAGTAVRGFVQMIESMRFETQGLSLRETVQVMLERSGLVAHYQAEREGQERVENLEELVNAAAAFDYDAVVADPDAPAEQVVMSALSAFLSHASLEAGDNQAAEGQDAVQLMTIHSAKGLEFHAVFLTGLEEGLFPHENSMTELNGLEEERRLMYVAMTRARRRLYLSMSQTRMLHGQTRYNMRSRFMEELPEGNLKWLAPRVAARSMSSMSAVGGLDDSESNWRRPAGAWTRQGMGQSNSGGGGGQPSSLAWSGSAGHESGYKVGEAVRHSRFGDGVITALEGSGNDARAQIRFKRDGSKWLALSVAKLERV